MAESQQNLSKMVSTQLRSKANQFLSSRKHANKLVDILQQFENEAENFTPVLLTAELVFGELLKRGEMLHNIVPLQPTDNSPESSYRLWLIHCYDVAWRQILGCFLKGAINSREQALVTAMKLISIEGKHPIESDVQPGGFYFPQQKLRTIFIKLLDSDTNMIPVINRFQEFAQYKDVLHYSVKSLAVLGSKKSPSVGRPTCFFIRNYLELLDKCAQPNDTRKSHHEGDEHDVLCKIEGRAAFVYQPAAVNRRLNKCWSQCYQWPLTGNTDILRRALLLLVEKLLPRLNRPHLATDLLMDSLDAGGPVSMLALQGILELMRRHNIEYPDIYTKLYSMFEPEIFVMRYKERLLHLTDIFLSSTHLPEALVASFAKRLSRLALLAPVDDIISILCLIGNIISRHPALKVLVCRAQSRHSYEKLSSIDTYIMEERSPMESNAIESSLWEVECLKSHSLPSVSQAACRLLSSTSSNQTPQFTLEECLDDSLGDMFDREVKRYFKSIELNFIRPQSMINPSGEKLHNYFEVIH